MPELPDVEVFRRYLDATSLRRPIASAELLRPSMLHGVTAGQLRKGLEGQRLVGAARHGKHLLVQTSGQWWLTLHFGMTGFLRFAPAGQRGDDEVITHPRLILHFRSGDTLTFDDKRAFGTIGLAGGVEEFVAERRLGPDALVIDEDGLAHALHGERPVKSVLMDQERIAGLGNVYADEALFHARLHPATPANRLERKEVGRLYRAMVDVISTAIDHEADPSRMPQDWLLTRRRKGADCPACGGRVQQERLAGRTAYFCPACQKPK